MKNSNTSIQNNLSDKELKKLLNYNKETGIFTWKVKRGNRKIGDKATIKCSGYIEIQIYGFLYKAHRLAWLYTYGEWPKNDIDHINGIRHDNRICNLREATRTENLINGKISPRNTTGYKGVSLDNNGDYRARISLNKKQIYLGLFKTPEEAHKAYLEKAKEFYGEFAYDGVNQR